MKPRFFLTLLLCFLLSAPVFSVHTRADSLQSMTDMESAASLKAFVITAEEYQEDGQLRLSLIVSEHGAYGGLIFVNPEYSAIYNTAGNLFIDPIQEGMEVEIFYTGSIQESYPGILTGFEKMVVQDTHAVQSVTGHITDVEDETVENRYYKLYTLEDEKGDVWHFQARSGQFAVEHRAGDMILIFRQPVKGTAVEIYYTNTSADGLYHQDTYNFYKVNVLESTWEY